MKSRVWTKSWPAALLVAILLSCGVTQGGEVTVVGSPRVVDRSAPLPANPGSWQQIHQSPDGVVQTSAENGGEHLAPEEPTLFQDTSGPPNLAAGTSPVCAEIACGPPPSMWTIDYRFRTLAASDTAYEFGTPDPPPTGYAPLSQLNFPINSCWHGLRVGYQEPTWDAHFEWMTPQQGILGQFSDYDWEVAGNPYTDLGFAKERWVDGQMIDFGMEFLWTDRAFNLPIEIWPTAGFRWQRFNLMCYDAVQVKYDNVSLDPPDLYPGDILTFDQQYYMGYLGGQFRTRLRTVRLTFQADWGYTWANNIDHHLLREGNRYTMDNTQGNSWHIAFTAEVPLSPIVSGGFQVDHMQIRTTGTHHLLNLPSGEDSTWDNGVSVSSNQTSIMAFLRFRT